MAAAEEYFTISTHIYDDLLLLCYLTFELQHDESNTILNIYNPTQECSKKGLCI